MRYDWNFLDLEKKGKNLDLENYFLRRFVFVDRVAKKIHVA